ncbi:MAG: TolC family protein [Leptonema sp. (in: bacteria)]
MKFFYFLVIFLIGSVASSSFPYELTLKQCIQMALEKNPEVKQKFWLEIAKKNSLEQTYSEFYPKIFAQYGYKKNYNQNNNETSIPNKNYFATLEVQQNLYNQSFLTKMDLAKGEYSIAQLDFQKQKEDIVYKVIQTYIMILILMESIKVTEESLNYYKQYVESIQKFVDYGLRTYNDLLKANTELKNAEVEVVKLKNQLNLSKFQLLFLIGLLKENQNDIVNIDILRLDPEEILLYFNTKKEIVKTTLQKLESFPELYQLALTYRKDYLIQKKELELSQLEISLQKYGYYPFFGAAFTYSRIDDQYNLKSPERKTWDLNVFIKIPIFEGFNTKNKIEEYESLNRVQLEKENFLKQNIALELESNLHTYNELLKKLQYYKESYKFSKENLNLLQKRYNNGLGTFLELSDATNLYYISSRNLIQTQYEIELKKIEILKLLGIILEIL